MIEISGQPLSHSGNFGFERRAKAAFIVFLILGSLSIFPGLVHALGLSDLNKIIAELTEHLTTISVSGDADLYSLAEFGIKASAPDVAADQARDRLREMTDDGRFANLRGQLRKVFDDGRLARRAVDGIDATLLDTPDFGRIAYCRQAAESQQAIVQITRLTADLNKLAGLAASYKRSLVSLDKMATVTGNALGLFISKVNTDSIVEETSYGTLGEQWQFFTSETYAGSEGDPNAAYLESNARTDWDYVERTARDKSEQLQLSLKYRQAYHEHFYATMKSCDAGPEPVPANTNASVPAPVPPKPSVGTSGAGDCALLGNMSASNALMNRDRDAWLDLVGRCTTH